MYLIKHNCTNYRNIESTEFLPSPGVNVISGQNGHGKTNLLESIFLLTGARSFRGGKEAALIKQDCDFALVNTVFFIEDREQEIKIKISDKGRTASLNRGTETKAAALVGKLCCVVFSPEHLELVKKAPETRRRFLDTALCQISSSYLGNIKRYNRLLVQRNNLLKDANYIGAAFEMLDVYDSQFVETACVITQQRRNFVAELLPLAKRNYDAISNAREELDFIYKSTMFPLGTADYDEGMQRIIGARAEEIRAGFSTIGPHRDDVIITLDGSDAKVFASQGQQRCIVLSLKLAEAELMELKLGERPVLLLDDVLSELDADRQDYLIDSITDGQAIITSCAPELISGRTDAEVFTITDGRLGQ
jgi:recF protein